MLFCRFIIKYSGKKYKLNYCNNIIKEYCCFLQKQKQPCNWAVNCNILFYIKNNDIKIFDYTQKTDGNFYISISKNTFHIFLFKIILKTLLNCHITTYLTRVGNPTFFCTFCNVLYAIFPAFSAPSFITVSI